MPDFSQKPELLAPAGSLESFFAALEKGADAVYAGLRDFSARARAKNFTLAQMERMLAYAHAHGRRLYVTLNTLVKEKELPSLVDTLAALAGMGADGVIVQDMAVARLVRNHFPSIPLHASTQMTIHNTPGVQMLHELGFERAVLARELALDEVASIVRATPVEIEVFVHGALCFSISGQCFFSSYLGGHSGNRGRCAQPCRRLYEHRGKQGHYFSTNDLSTIDMIPDLARAGVASLKIEGRMKSAEYVANVVEAYRLVLDSSEHTQADSIKAAKEILKFSFGRTPTKGFLASPQPDDITNPWQKGGTGRFVGQVKTIQGSRLTFESRDTIHIGDRLRVQPKSDMAGQAWTVRELFQNRRPVMESRPGTPVEVVTPFSFKAGDAIYKVSSREAFTLSDSACQRRLDSAPRQKLRCRLKASLIDSTLRIEAAVAGLTHAASFPLGPLESSRSNDMLGVLQAQFSKTGDTLFELESLEAPGFPAVLIPSSLFKQIRRDLYRQLEEQVSCRLRQERAVSREAALKELQLPSRFTGNRPREVLTVLIDQPREWRFPLLNGADSVAISLTRSAIHLVPSLAGRMRESADRIIWQLPFILFDRDTALLKGVLEQLHQAGFRRFEVSNLSHFALLKGLAGVRVSAWHRCFTLNSQALLAWHERGAESVTLYLEDDAANLADLLAYEMPVERRLLVFGPLPVMTTKIKIRDVHTNIPLHSDRGEEYSVSTRDGLQTIYAKTPFCLTGRRQELQQSGCSSFVMDLSQEPRDRWPDIMSAFRSARPVPGSTEFNYPQELV